MPKPHIFYDSDVAKFIESAAYIVQKDPDPELERFVEGLIDKIQKNQCENGYFNSYFLAVEPDNIFKRRDAHELYCAGHLTEAALAWYDATGSDRFLAIMRRFIDYIEKVFVVDQSASFMTPGHEEIELALFKLYRATGEVRYRDLAMFFLNNRGTNDKDTTDFVDSWINAFYNQSHAPVREQFTAEGHSVRACYLYAAMADAAQETGDDALFEACKKIFDDIVSRKMYITGGIGQSHVGEAFTVPYDLPGRRAYAETCAGIAMAFFALRMFEIDPDSKYADVIERLMYNGILSGVSLGGSEFFYENPLEIYPPFNNKDVSVSEEHREHFPAAQRMEVFDCSCCPPNLTRFIASIGDYIYSKIGEGVFINQYISSDFAEGKIKVKMEADYLTSGSVRITATGVNFIAARMPSWCKSFAINQPFSREGGYVFIYNTSKPIELQFEMTAKLVSASHLVIENNHKVALTYGPLVYCAESADNGPNISNLAISRNLNAEIKFDPYMAADVITVDGWRLYEQESLYADYTGRSTKTRIKFVPYFAFANRGEAEMLVWMHAI
jgi:DUF1680 family protein